ncbi:2Fe-2S iron-sulfur cluster-binding protein [Streptomyces sp. NRRL WC-3744]|uniref:2Fe-2S iron-sulfur cluster-binding protein n=1 Tax=Streptomyces sp. NRRL WC-3744 TaxID=1463935 RepID=UPI0004C7CB25|nr:2Fe-2S iron-sulfur cluster-binding protein [Streptomyces sp. NRRL WC-3744]
MTDDQHGEGTPQGGGRWDPLPQGDYDDGATAFVKLPEGGIDALLSGDSPLAAPGHGYVPPRITATHTDGTHPDGSTGTWPAPDGGGRWPDPNAAPAPPHAADDRFTYQPAATQHWTFEEPAAPAAPGHDVTGQWSIPVAGGDLPDESGEFTTSSLVEQWGAAPPATLPGGAPAPWATDGPNHAYPSGSEPAGAPQEYGAEDGYGPEEAYASEDGYAAESGHGSDDGYGAANAYVPEGGYGAENGYGHGPAGHAADGHVANGHAGAGHHGAAAPQDSGHADADAPGGTAAPTAPAEPAPSAHESAEAGTAPEGDAHGPAEAPERPADAPAGHEPPAGPATASQPATTPDTDDPAAPDDPAASADAPATTAAPGTPGAAHSPAPEPSAEAAVPDDPSEGTGAQEGSGTQEDAEGAAVPVPQHDDHPLASYVLRVNGTDRPVTDAWIGESLLYVLRERLGLAGAKDGCSQGECGACNVQVDGRLVASCLVPAVTAAGSEVRTVEGLAEDGQPSDVQRALARCGAVQCGFCVPGMAMTVHDLLEGNPAPTELETRQALCGNLCRCSGYRGVLEAVQEVVAEREAAHAGPETDADEARIPHQAGPGSGGVHPSAFEAPGAFDTPRRQDPYDTPDAYGGADRYDTPDPYGTPPGPHDQHYGQDGGQA